MPYMTSFMKKQEIDFSKLVDDCFLSPEEFAECLDKGVEMLFFIEEDTFDRKDVQSVVSAIKGIANALKKAK